MEENFNATDIESIKLRGISLSQVQNQLTILKNGIPKQCLLRPATLKDGIVKMHKQDYLGNAMYFDDKKKRFSISKFVPASGAASRMFKFLIEFLNEFQPETETIKEYIERKKDTNLTLFLKSKAKFPFHDLIEHELKKLHPSFKTFSKDQKNLEYIKLLLDCRYFDFTNKPKGILPFHHYGNHVATPLEEHLWEAAQYTTSKKKSTVHFTISETHLFDFETIVADVKAKIESKLKTKLQVSYSYQHPNTDAIAIDKNQNLLRDKTGNLIFRPGGHGALLQNLNALDDDLIFIKNIDNVIHSKFKDSSLYKKSLGACLMQTQEQIFAYLNNLHHNFRVEKTLSESVFYLKNDLNSTISNDYESFSEDQKIAYIVQKLNRPIRVCGMVKNTGEPGGGPFWVVNSNGNQSLQIIESSQIDHTNESQKAIFNQSTHFNPVDLVCSIKNFEGKKFDLNDFVDPNAGFIVEKNKNGELIKAYELPGLWNGAMAHWITIFLEMPQITFNPVKTVTDLLKRAHQPT